MNLPDEINLVSEEEGNRKVLIEIEDVHKSFGANPVLKGFNLKLYDGENLVIVGKSGSGKSVLIKCIIRLLTPDSGKLLVLGKSVPDLNRVELDEIRTEVGFLFQGSALYDSMTVRENLEFPLRRHPEKLKDQNVDTLVLESLRSVGLEHAIDLLPEELSGGMKRRVALARTLILRPKIILYDEPTSGLDPITSKEISDLILEIQKKYNTSSIIITHDIHCIKSTANEIKLLQGGIIYAEGTLEEFINSHNKEIKSYFL